MVITGVEGDAVVAEPAGEAVDVVGPTGTVTAVMVTTSRTPKVVVVPVPLSDPVMVVTAHESECGEVSFGGEARKMRAELRRRSLRCGQSMEIRSYRQAGLLRRPK